MSETKMVRLEEMLVHPMEKLFWLVLVKYGLGLELIPVWVDRELKPGTLQILETGPTQLLPQGLSFRLRREVRCLCGYEEVRLGGTDEWVEVNHNHSVSLGDTGVRALLVSELRAQTSDLRWHHLADQPLLTPLDSLPLSWQDPFPSVPVLSHVSGSGGSVQDPENKALMWFAMKRGHRCWAFPVLDRMHTTYIDMPFGEGNFWTVMENNGGALVMTGFRSGDRHEIAENVKMCLVMTISNFHGYQVSLFQVRSAAWNWLRTA